MLKKKIFQLIIASTLTFLGAFLGYTVKTSYSQNSLIDLLGFIAVLLILSGMFTMYEIPFSYFNKFYERYKTTNKGLASIFAIFNFTLAISVFALPVSIYQYYSSKYHRIQIETYGIVQDVIIDSESHGRNSNNYSNFSFFYNGKTWRTGLPIWRYKVGDTVSIIFSSVNPSEKEWYEKYLETKAKENSH